MLKVVFTGAAVDSYGRTVARDNLISACTEKGGIFVQTKVDANTNMLVASRVDTIKAKAAKAKGIPVVTYPQFISGFLRGAPLKTGGQLNPYTDKANNMVPDMLVPVFDDDVEILPLISEDAL